MFFYRPIPREHQRPVIIALMSWRWRVPFRRSRRGQAPRTGCSGCGALALSQQQKVLREVAYAQLLEQAINNRGSWRTRTCTTSRPIYPSESRCGTGRTKASDGSLPLRPAPLSDTLLSIWRLPPTRVSRKSRSNTFETRVVGFASCAACRPGADHGLDGVTDALLNCVRRRRPSQSQALPSDAHSQPRCD